MGVPSGLVPEPLPQTIARLGAEVLPPVSVPEMWSAGKKAMRGDYEGALGQATTELALSAIPFVGQMKKAGKVLGKNVAKSNVTNESVAAIFDALNADEAMVAARRGAHLKQNPGTGQYIGGPRGVDSPQKIGAMRAAVDAKVEDGVSNAAWYDRARATARNLTGFTPEMSKVSEEAKKASLFARGGAAYSPQATPPVEVNAFLRQHNEKVLRGNDIVPRTGSQARNVARAYEPNETTGGFSLFPERIKLGKKTGPYADAKDPTVDEKELYQTANDIWHGRVFGYAGSKKNPDAPFSRGFTPQEHGFLTGENLLMAERAQQKGLNPPGYDNFAWTPRAGQAATWGSERFNQTKAAQEKAVKKYERELARYEKAKARGKEAKKPTAPKIESDDALRAKANAGIDEAVAKHVAAINAEFAPGSNSGMYQGFGDVPKDVQDEFSRESLRVTGKYNPVTNAMQMFQEPTVMTRGEWTDDVTGEVSHSLTDVSKPLVGLKNTDLGFTATGKKRKGGQMIDDASRGALEVQSAIEGVLRGQQGVGVGKFTAANSSMKSGEKTGAHLAGTPEELAAARAALEGTYGLNVMDLGQDGLFAGKYAPSQLGPAASGTVWNSFVDGKEVQGAVKDALKSTPGAISVTPGRLESGLTTVPWGAEGSGQVARFLDEQLSRPDFINAAQRLDAANIPAMLDARRDVADRVLGPYNANVNRPDVQRLLDLISARLGGGFQNFQQYVRDNGFQGLPALGLMAGGAAAAGSARQNLAERRRQAGS